MSTFPTCLSQSFIFLVTLQCWVSSKLARMTQISLWTLLPNMKTVPSTVYVDISTPQLACQSLHHKGSELSHFLTCTRGRPSSYMCYIRLPLWQTKNIWVLTYFSSHGVAFRHRGNVYECLWPLFYSHRQDNQERVPQTSCSVSITRLVERMC